MSLREIAQEVRYDILFCQGLLNSKPFDDAAFLNAILRLTQCLQIDNDEARRLIETVKSKDDVDRYVESRRKVLRPNWEAEL